MAKVTKRLVESIAPAQKDVFVWDSEIKGFGVRVKPSGVRSYLVQYRTREGRSGRFTLGKHGVLTADEARKKARVVLAQVLEGADPAAEKQAARHPKETVTRVFETYLALHARPKLRTAQEVERHFRRDVAPMIGPLDLTAVTRKDIVRVHDQIATRSESSARGTLRILSSFFGWCVKRDLIPSNPCLGLEKAVPRARERALTPEEVVEVLRAAEALSSPWPLLVRMLAITGQRLREVANLRWEELDLAAALWTLPPERTKNKREHKIPLPPDLAARLAAWTPMEGPDGTPCPFVFSTNGRVAVSGFSPMKRRLDALLQAKRSEADPTASPLAPWRLHDLRRSVASGMGDMGIAVPTIERALNHVSGTFAGLVGVYQRQELWTERQRAFHAWESHVLTLAKGGAGENVVPLRGR